MKDILKIVFALLLSFSIQSNTAFASLSDTMQNYVEQQQIQSLTNGLNNINNSINAQTRALKDAQWQQKMAALNQECVAYTTADIRARDTYIRDTDKAIEDYKAEMQKNNDISDSAVKQQMSLHLNYLYTLRSRQNNFYRDFINSQCTNLALNTSCVESNGPNWEMASVDAVTGNIKCRCATGYVRGSTGSSCVEQQFQQSAPSGGGGSIPTSGLQCNGKSWNACPAGYNFFCPSSGDASCTPQQQPQMVTPPLGGEGVGVTQEPPKVTSIPVKDKPATISAPPTKKKSPVVSNSVASTINKDIPQLVNASVDQVKTKKKGAWSWFKGLFGF